jgi:hypothetical protein
LRQISKAAAMISCSIRAMPSAFALPDIQSATSISNCDFQVVSPNAETAKFTENRA